MQRILMDVLHKALIMLLWGLLDFLWSIPALYRTYLNTAVWTQSDRRGCNTLKKDKDRFTLPCPISTKLVRPVALPSIRLNVKVPSSVISKESMNSSIMPVFLSKLMVYFWGISNLYKCVAEKEWVECMCKKKVPSWYTFPWVMMLSLKTYSIWHLEVNLATCAQKRTRPFSCSSTAISVLKGITATTTLW